MTTMEYRVVTISGEVHRVTVVWSDTHEAWTDPGDHDTSDAPTLMVMAEALRRGLLVREIVPPGDATRDEVVMSERSRCAALARSVADAIDTDAAREMASAIIDEMLRDRSLSLETPAQAYGRGRLAGLAEAASAVRAEVATAEREACAALCDEDCEKRAWRAGLPYTRNPEAERAASNAERELARSIRARGETR